MVHVGFMFIKILFGFQEVIKFVLRFYEFIRSVILFIYRQARLLSVHRTMQKSAPRPRSSRFPVHVYFACMGWILINPCEEGWGVGWAFKKPQNPAPPSKKPNKRKKYPRFQTFHFSSPVLAPQPPFHFPLLSLQTKNKIKIK